MNENDNKILYEYIRDLIYKTDKAVLDKNAVSEDARQLAGALEYLGECVKEEHRMLSDMASGNIQAEVLSKENVLAAPLKDLQSSLRHLAWVADRVSMGDYKQRVHMLGGLSDAFNKMITQLDYSRAELERAGRTDPLTRVGNRRAFNGAARELLNSGKRFSIAFIDIDSLKGCNDRFGHAEGDNYICNVCSCLSAVCHSEEELFRIGGDEFVILSETDSKTELEERLTEARREFVESMHGKVEYVCNFSYGCVDAEPDELSNFDESLSNADRRMYEFKLKSGHGRE